MGLTHLLQPGFYCCSSLLGMSGRSFPHFSQWRSLGRELPEYAISLSLFLQNLGLVCITVQALFGEELSGSFTHFPDCFELGLPGWDKTPKRNVNAKTFLKSVVLFRGTYLSHYLPKFRLWPRHIFSTQKCGKPDSFHCSGHISLKQPIIKVPLWKVKDYK